MRKKVATSRTSE